MRVRSGWECVEDDLGVLYLWSRFYEGDEAWGRLVRPRRASRRSGRSSVRSEVDFESADMSTILILHSSSLTSLSHSHFQGFVRIPVSRQETRYKMNEYSDSRPRRTRIELRTIIQYPRHCPHKILNTNTFPHLLFHSPTRFICPARVIPLACRMR